jgi:hypothetical protein
MKSIFLLHIRQIFRENDWILPLLLLVVASIVGASLAPSNEDPSLQFSARTQTIWITAWFCSIFWVGFVSAKLGSFQRTKGLREFWKALGVSDAGYFLSLLLIPLICNSFIFGLAGGLTFVVGRTPEVPVAEWASVNAQAVFFAVLAQTSVTAVIVALTNWLAIAPAFTCGLLINLYGLYGIGAVDQVRSGKDPFLSNGAEILWTIGPHFHFADFLPRLTFGWGALPAKPFLFAALYLAAIALVSLGVGSRLWRFRRS